MAGLKELVAAWLAGDAQLAPITELLGVRPLAISAGMARLEMTAEPRLHNAMGTLHGGVFCDLADIAIGAAVASESEEGETFTTLQIQVSYLRAIQAGRLIATARVIRRGSSTAYLECEVEDALGNLAAKVTSVVALRRARKEHVD